MIPKAFCPGARAAGDERRVRTEARNEKRRWEGAGQGMMGVRMQTGFHLSQHLW